MRKEVVPDNRTSSFQGRCMVDMSFLHTVQGTSVCQVTVIGAIVILLYASRACYNLVVLGLSNKSINSFDYDWYNVSDQVNHQRS